MSITAAQKYLLNHMNSVANTVQLGDLLDSADSVVAGDIALAEGKMLVGNGSGVGSALTLTSAQIVVGNGSSVAAAVTVSGDVTISNAGVTAIGANKVTEAMQATQQAAGLHSARVAHGIFDATAGKAVAAHTLGATIPNNAFITGAWYWVKTTFTSATDAGTIALHVQAANDVVTAIAINDGSNPWDTSALPVETTPVVEDSATWLKTTAARDLTATVAVEALTAGVMHVWVQYVVFE